MVRHEEQGRPCHRHCHQEELDVRDCYYSDADQARLHPPGLDMPLGGGAYFMRPESAEALASGLVQLDRATGNFRRVQLTPGDERRIIEEARARAEAGFAGRDQPTPWASSRP